MRPQLNTNYRHLCSPSNPVTAELFGDDLKAVKDITDTNRLKWSGSIPGRDHCVVFLGKTLYSHSAPLHPGVQMGSSKYAGATLRWTSTPSRGE